MNRLFVYGIFLSQRNREDYGMTNPRYAVVRGHATVHKGGSIVEAVDFGIPNLGLTGLIVDVNPKQWDEIDALEYGYDRVKVTTINGDEAWMYRAQKGKYAEA